MGLRFAFAMTNDYSFGENHFGDADLYLICEGDKNGINKIEEITNRFKSMDENHEHGSKKKGQAIIDSLRDIGVEVLVSKQFGRNIKMVNNHFVPVIISADTVDEVTGVLRQHYNWIEDEITNQPERYKLFDLRKGVLKTIIPND